MQMPNFITHLITFPINIIETLIDILWFLMKNLIEDYEVEAVHIPLSPVSIILII